MIKERLKFGKLLNDLSLNGFGIEIGVEHGNFSEVILKTSCLRKLLLLDPWKKFDAGKFTATQEMHDGRFKSVKERFRSFGDRAKIIRKNSEEGHKTYKDNFFDFIYIDANHEYEHIVNDLNWWYPKLKVGGLFAGHDYVDKVHEGCKFGVKTAVNEFIEDKDVEFHFTKEKTWKSWFWVK